jgi:hypothetical protein
LSGFGGLPDSRYAGGTQGAFDRFREDRERHQNPDIKGRRTAHRERRTGI